MFKVKLTKINTPEEKNNYLMRRNLLNDMLDDEGYANFQKFIYRYKISKEYYDKVTRQYLEARKMLFLLVDDDKQITKNRQINLVWEYLKDLYLKQSEKSNIESVLIYKKLTEENFDYRQLGYKPSDITQIMYLKNKELKHKDSYYSDKKGNIYVEFCGVIVPYDVADCIYTKDTFKMDLSAKKKIK